MTTIVNMRRRHAKRLRQELRNSARELKHCGCGVRYVGPICPICYAPPAEQQIPAMTQEQRARLRAKVAAVFTMPETAFNPTITRA